jgi:carbamoyltransferase
VRCAISEERLTRKKGCGGWLYSLKYCLAALDLRLEDVSRFVFSCYGELLPGRFDGGLASLGVPREKCTVVDHHLSHAYSAFYLSPFKEALIAVIDGRGNEHETESYYVGQGSRIVPIGGNEKRDVCQGIGKTYEAFTNFLGWPVTDAAKTMALAAYGDDGVFGDLELFEVRGDQVRSKLRHSYAEGVVRFAAEAGLDFGEPFQRGQTQRSRDVAAFVQRRTEGALVALLRYLVDRTGCRSVCLAGGVALNCVANRRILDECGVESLFIVPAANDKGQCLGNAIYGNSQLSVEPIRVPMLTDAFGRHYQESDIQWALEKMPQMKGNLLVGVPSIEYAKVSDAPDAAATLLAAGKVVGWFQGGAELGPRALGQRSILADPRRMEISRRLSERVKIREAFQPYAPSILGEYAEAYFDLPCSSPYMLLIGRARPRAVRELPAVVHVDGTARVQTVCCGDDRLFREVLLRFLDLTGVPAVLNTSFNLAGEPIVETPADALSTFLRSDMDYLVMGNFLVSKSESSLSSCVTSWTRTNGFSIRMKAPTREGGPATRCELSS